MGKDIKLKVQGGKVVEDEVKEREGLITDKITLIAESLGKKPKDQIPNIISVLNYILNEVNKNRVLGSSAFDKGVEALTLAEGKNLGFENSFKTEEVKTPVLSESQESVYGKLGTPEMQDIVHGVLGNDCFAFVKEGGVLPKTQLSILVSKRLSKKKDDFRTLMINNASASMDTKKWCEKVKSNLFKQYSSKSEGTPDFKITR